MKNIHLLPTDKPSRLFLNKINNKLLLDSDTYSDLEKILPSSKYQHIYITSNEEIKDVRPHKGKWQLEKGEILNKFPNYLTDLSECKLVIITTDQDLIKDGVQAIDDEFLEWFVKNPSCENIKVELIEEIPSGFTFGMFGNDEPPTELVYKIIIPTEEPKPHSFCETLEEKCTMNYCDENGCQNRKRVLVEPKQKTLEEVAERFFNKRAKEEGFENWTQIIVQQEWEFIETFPIEFAKWQAERRYSEEEVFNLCREFAIFVQRNGPSYEKQQEWFEEFKKK